MIRRFQTPIPFILQIEYDLEDVETRLKIYARRKLASLAEDTEKIDEQLRKSKKDKSKLLEEKITIERLLAATKEDEECDIDSVAKERVELLQKVTQAEEELEIEKRRLEKVRHNIYGHRVGDSLIIPLKLLPRLDLVCLALIHIIWR